MAHYLDVEENKAKILGIARRSALFHGAGADSRLPVYRRSELAGVVAGTGRLLPGNIFLPTGVL